MNNAAWHDIDPPAGLKSLVIARVDAAIIRRNATRKFVGIGTFVASFAALSYCIVILIQEIGKSGFSTYASLAFTDSKLVLANFGQFALSLADSLPVAALTLALAAFLAVLAAARYLANSKTVIQYA
ncbi:MAG: hypothetical protein KGH93_02000 [Patescibacteria group bacterium]|nr:hypothetical protein [Patescibacteria group bacterium]MDE1945951.1 hypothetical protein [Patescibacteria group bacterium]